MTPEWPASGERPPEIETVRAAIVHRGKVLLLEKDVTSQNAGALEFPGGNIDDQAGDSSTDEEQRQALLAEISQETGIAAADMPMQKLETFSYYFEAGAPEAKKPHRRRTHLFLVTLPDDRDVSVSVRADEDRHSGYRWVTPEELQTLARTVEKDTRTKRLARNSRHIKLLLQALEQR